MIDDMADCVIDSGPLASDTRPNTTGQSRPNPRRGWDWSESEVGDSSPDPKTGRESASTKATPIFLTLCISTYPEDLHALDQAVAHCKQSGLPGMSRSKLIRIALKRLDLEQVIAELRGVR